MDFLVIYVKLYKNKVFSDIKSIKSDDFITNFINEFCSPIKKKGFILSYIILFSISALLFIINFIIKFLYEWNKEYKYEDNKNENINNTKENKNKIINNTEENKNENIINTEENKLNNKKKNYYIINLNGEYYIATIKDNKIQSMQIIPKKQIKSENSKKKNEEKNIKEEQNELKEEYSQKKEENGVENNISKDNKETLQLKKPSIKYSPYSDSIEYYTIGDGKTLKIGILSDSQLQPSESEKKYEPFTNHLKKALTFLLKVKS